MIFHNLVFDFYFSIFMILLDFGTNNFNFQTQLLHFAYETKNQIRNEIKEIYTPPGHCHDIGRGPGIDA